MHATIDGQVVLPRNIQEKLQITPDADLEFIEENGRFYLVNLSTISTYRRTAVFAESFENDGHGCPSVRIPPIHGREIMEEHT